MKTKIAAALLLCSTAAMAATPEPVVFAGSVWDGGREVSRFEVRVLPGATARLEIGDGRTVEMEVPLEGNITSQINLLDANGDELHSSATDVARDHSVRYVICPGKLAFLSPEPTAPSPCPSAP